MAKRGGRKGGGGARAAGGARTRGGAARTVGLELEVYPPGTLSLDAVDLSAEVGGDEYEERVVELQQKAFALQIEGFQKGLRTVVAFEGWDAAGKGGCIKRLTALMDPRGYKVWPIAAPRDEDARHHWLWRFWRRLPEAGELTVFDRTWYGRVLVERVEGFCSEAEWRRAYHEINEFERSLVNAGAVVAKYWLHISSETQLARFRDREKDPTKRYKITEEDWRNRKKWGVYRAAVQDMITQTSTTYAPWTIVEADDKNWARIRCLNTLVRAIEKRLGA
jgi:polyphosphate kinase 2 (PPK2 family)